MANALQLRRGTTTQHSTFTGLAGEVTVDTTKDTVVVHDGATAGGIPLATEDSVSAANLLTAIKTVDGAGSGLDADLLDGQTGTYYTNYADTAVANLVASAPSTLDTLNELAAALGDDPNFATTMTNSLAGKANLSGASFTGNVDISGTFAVNSGTANAAGLFQSTDATASLYLIDGNTTGGASASHGLITTGDELNIRAVGQTTFDIGTTERARLTNDKFLIHTTATNIGSSSSGEGFSFNLGESFRAQRDNGEPIIANRVTTDGAVIAVRKNGAGIGEIGVNTDRIYMATTNKGVAVDESAARFVPTNGSGGSNDNVMDLGQSNARWKDLYLSNDALVDGTVSAASITSSANLTVGGSLSINEVIESVGTSASTSGTIFFNVLNGSVKTFTANQTANRTINFTGDGSTQLNSVMAVDESVTVTALMTQGSTAYYLNAYQIDGTAVTPKWSGGSAPTAGNASGIDVYTFTIIKTANATFTVLASVTQYA